MIHTAGHKFVPRNTHADGFIRIGNYAFAENGLTNIIISDYVTFIGDGAFAGWGVKTVYIGSSVWYIGDYSFSWGFSLESIIVSENNNTFKSIDGVLYSKDGTVLIKCPEMYSVENLYLPEGVIIIRKNAFANCGYINNIILPDSLVRIEKEAFNGANIRSITIGQNVTEIGSFNFANSPNLKI